MIHFVGAGPGAPDLITVRGKQYLEEADVIIYAGSLVNPQLLEYSKDVCTIQCISKGSFFAFQICYFDHLFLHPIQILRIFSEDSTDIAHCNMRKSVCEKQFCDCNTGTSGTIYNDFTGLFVFSCYF